MASSPIPNPPKGTKTNGAKLWRAIVGRYELEEHEYCLLREMVRCVDLLDALQVIVQREGEIVTGPHGSKPHPAVVEARQARIALARLTAALRLPAGDQVHDPVKGRRPQRRVGVRGVYAVGS